MERRLILPNLLTKQENRRYRLITKLSMQNTWITLANLATYLDCSSRVLKDDIQYLNKKHKNLSIQTSKYGIRMSFRTNYDLNSFGREVLAKSPAYQLLETIFFNGPQTIKELANQIFVSPATLYRMINQINETLVRGKYNFTIDTNPCRFIGVEEDIRYYFYIYIFERYRRFTLPLKDVNEDALERFLRGIVEGSSLTMDYSFYNVVRVVMIVNLVRYREKAYIEVDTDDLLPPRKAENFDDYSEIFKSYEEILGVKINENFITQTFTPYIQKGMSYSYEYFINRTKENPTFGKQVTFLRNRLDDIAKKHGIKLENREGLIVGLFNTSHLEYQDPQSNYILYNRNQLFAEDISKEFPRFYIDLYEGMKEFRIVLGKDTTEEGIAFFFYNVFATWKNLVPQLRQKIKKIRTLVISDRHQAHAEMIKDFIEYEFSEQVAVEFFIDLELNSEVLEELNYDLIVTTFTIDTLKNRRNVYIPNVPKYKDYQNIQQQIDEIIAERMQ